ncbi:MAG TPA: potassium transporter, partial [Bacillota bacterium]|nr:potassium transporter [Bacillota bacterium]
PDYDHFLTFIQEIEKQERMMFVGNLDFQKPAEQELIINEEPTEIIVANVNIVTFFYDQEL